jgi:biopolymer transport protein ExbD/biopolymer transport protein TolR
MKLGHTRRPDPVVDVTPMIDIVFQLVLFFMVSTTFISAPGIQVDLPRANAQVVLSDKEDINIWMTADGEVYVDDVPVDLPTLKRRLRRTAERDLSTLVVIKADAGVEHGRVVTVMDMARGFGLTRLAIATEAPQAAGDDAPTPPERADEVTP